MAATDAAQPAENTSLFSPKEIPDVDIIGFVTGITDRIGSELSLNSLMHYALALCIAVGGSVLVWLIKGLLARVTAHWLSSVDKQRVDKSMAREVADTFVPLLYLFPLYFAVHVLNFSRSARSMISLLIIILFTTRGVRFLSALASFVTDTYLRRHQQSVNSSVGKALNPIIRVLFWTLGITIILDNIGFQVSSLIAGLGIVGIAVGLAGQTILADFFGYLVILMDRPFTIGDFITAGNVSGTVESIGLKTTRIRTTSGEVVVYPNGDVSKQQISNFRMMYRRSRTFTIGVAYETPPATVRAIPAMVREIADGIHGLTVTRVFFTEFGDSSLNFEVLVSYAGRSLDETLEAQQEMFLGLMDRFEKEGIVFAYPTRTVYVANTLTPGQTAPGGTAPGPEDGAV